MPKETALIIKAPIEGIAISEHLGFADVRQLNVYNKPGIAKLNNLVVKVSSTTIDAPVNWIVRHPNDTAQFFALSNNGKVWKSSDSMATWAQLTGNTTTAAHGNGLYVWRNYLFVARDALLDCCGDGTTTGITSGNWTTPFKNDLPSDVLWHSMYESYNDGKLYISAGKYISSLEELTTFAPGTASSYTWTPQALDLPTGYRIKALAELGSTLMAGTWRGTSVADFPSADIFPWDRSSPSFGQPIRLNENGVHALLNFNGQLVVLAGITGKIFVSNGASAYEVARLPGELVGAAYWEWLPGALVGFKNKIFCGVSNAGTSVGNIGVYSVDLSAKGSVLTLEHLNSSGLDGSAGGTVAATALMPVTRNTLGIGWESSGDGIYAIDLTSNTSFVTSYGGYFDSPLFEVGDIDQKFQFEKLKIKLAKKLASGEGIRIAYRISLSDSFTTLGTYDYASCGAVMSIQAKAGIPACETVQFRISLTGSSTTPEFKWLKVI
jgi:hypothetical protein